MLSLALIPKLLKAEANLFVFGQNGRPHQNVKTHLEMQEVATSEVGILWNLAWVVLGGQSEGKMTQPGLRGGRSWGCTET